MAILDINIPDADEAKKGIAEIATQVETDAGTDDARILTPLKLEQSDLVQTTVSANTAKVTNATHTGEVTGNGALTVDPTAISNKTLKATPAGTEEVLINDAGTLKKTTAQDIADLSASGINTIAYIYSTSSGTNLADLADYFLMFDSTQLGATNNSQARAPIRTGTVVRADIVSYYGGTMGSSENSTVTFEHSDGASSDVLSTTVKFDARNTLEQITGLSISVTEGLSWMKLDTPAFATNPTAARLIVVLYMEI